MLVDAIGKNGKIQKMENYAAKPYTCAIIAIAHSFATEPIRGAVVSWEGCESWLKHIIKPKCDTLNMWDKI